MNKLLFRISLALVAFACALGLLTILVISLSNQVRHQHYWSDLVTPPMRFLAESQALLTNNRLNSLSVVAQQQSQFDTVTLARFNLGQVVLDTEDGLFKARTKLGDGLLLELESDISGRSFYELYLWLVKLSLGDETNDTSHSIQTQLGIQFRVSETFVDMESQWLLESIADKGQYLAISENEIKAYLQAPGGEIYKVDFPLPYQSTSWLTIALLVVLAFIALLSLVYLLIQNFDRKLRGVENVVSRIARGELDARVKNSGSENALDRLSTAFNSMADQIQRLMLIQKEMIHAVSHELRTPVARIRFGVQMIEDSPSQDALQAQVKGIDGDIQELDELIDEILTYARLEQGGLIFAFQEANVEDIVHQVVGEQSGDKPDLNIRAEFTEESKLWADADVEARYIHRSIQNLVGNATRYASGNVLVSCSFNQETCRVDIEDDGPGIPEDQWESVFTPFARLDDSRTRSSGGYGLGLSIVRRILYWHGGQAFLGRSERLGGAKFSLVWPRKQQEADIEV